MKVFVIILVFLSAITANAQNVNNHLVAPKGVYKDIDQKRELAIIELLVDSNYKDKVTLIHSIKDSANRYAPPVLYFLSRSLFNSGQHDEASYWYYVAQLRSRYDVNRCTDKTVSATQYNQVFGEVINPYAMKDLNNLEKIIKKVVAFVSTNDEQYDQRWINLPGMDAMQASLGNKKINKELSIEKNKWPEIKAKTINDYMTGFNELLLSQKKKNEH